MTESGSYFNNVAYPLSKIEYCSIKPHITYVKQLQDKNDVLHKLRRNEFSREINSWLEYPFINNENSYEYRFDNDELTINRDICISIYKQLINTIYSSGYEIDDINQFKEDFIYYMYILSDNTKY